jgi:hypothetical protein
MVGNHEHMAVDRGLHGKRFRPRLMLIALGVVAVIATCTVGRSMRRRASAVNHLNRITADRLGDHVEVERVVDDADRNIFDPMWVLYQVKLDGFARSEVEGGGLESQTFEQVENRWVCKFDSLPKGEVPEPGDTVKVGLISGHDGRVRVAVVPSIGRAWICVVYG